MKSPHKNMSSNDSGKGKPTPATEQAKKPPTSLQEPTVIEPVPALAPTVDFARASQLAAEVTEEIPGRSNSVLEQFSTIHEEPHLAEATARQQTAKKSSIRELVFQRLVNVFPIIPADQLQSSMRDYIKAKNDDRNLSFYDFLLARRLVPEATLRKLQCLRDPDGTSLITGYEVTDFIGEGGMAAVYHGRSSGDRQQVAIKILLPMDDASSEVMRFQRECNLTMALDHPHIVKAFASGEFFGLYYFVMEYVNGVSLADKLGRDGALCEKDVVPLFDKILQAMSYAWKQGLVHRDIKPANIMIGDSGPKICDFGLAKALDSEIQLTQTGAILGTPQYMSPEQFSGAKLDYRTDVYSLGVTLYVLLTGKLPFPGNSYVNLCKSHLYDEPPDPLACNAKLSRPMVSFLYQLLAKDPQQRCNTPDDLWHDWQRVKSGKLPRSRMMRVSSGGNKRTVAWSLLALLLIAAGLAYRYADILSLPIIGKPPAQKPDNSQARHAIEEEKRRLAAEREKLLRAQEQERLKEEADRQLLAERLRKDAELERLRQQQLAAAAKEKFILSLQSIRDSLEKLDLQYAQQEMRHLEVDFPNEQKMLEMKQTVQLLCELQRQLQQQETTAAALIQQCAQHPLRLQIAQKLLLQELAQGPSAHQIGVAQLWLQTDREHQKPLLSFIEQLPEQRQQDLFLALPMESARRLAALYETSSELAPRVAYLKTLYKSLASLRQTKQPLKLSALVSQPNASVLLHDCMRYLTTADKLRIVSAVPALTEEVGEPQLLALVTEMMAQADPGVHSGLASALASAKPHCANAALHHMLRHEKEAPLRVQLMQALHRNKAYQSLAVAVEDASEEVRNALVMLLHKDASLQAEGLLLQMAKDAVADIRVRSFQALGNRRSRAALPLLLQALRSSDSKVAESAAIALADIDCEEALRGMMTALGEIDNQSVTRVVVAQIARYNQQQAWQFLISLLIDKPEHSKEAAVALSKCGKAVVPALLERLKATHDRREQGTLLSVLENIGSPAVEVLCTLGNSTPDITLKRSIIKALGNIGDDQAIPLLLKMMADNMTKKIAAQALKTIADRLEPQDPRRQKIRQVLSEY